MKRYRLFLGFVAILGAIGSAHAELKDRCTILTQEEATATLGEPVKPGAVAILGCQWERVGGNGFVQVEVAGARYYERPPKTAKMIPGIGLEAYAYTELGSPHAIAKTSKSVVIVWASGDKATSERVIDLLRTVVGRVEQE